MAEFTSAVGVGSLYGAASLAELVDLRSGSVNRPLASNAWLEGDPKMKTILHSVALAAFLAGGATMATHIYVFALAAGAWGLWLCAHVWVRGREERDETTT